MALPRPGETEPLRRRFPRFSQPLMEVLEACLQVRGLPWWLFGCGRRCGAKLHVGAAAEHAASSSAG